jgi:hypothetical protein
MEELSAAQQLLPVKLALGKPIQLRPYEQVLSHKITDDEIFLSIRTWEFRETKSEVRFLKSGIRLRNWKLLDGKWVEQFYRGADGHKHSVVLWDDDFEPFTERLIGHSLTPDEYYDRIKWEAETYRVGTSRYPLDNYHCTMAAGPHGSTPDMYRYWTRHDKILEELGDDDGSED